MPNASPSLSERVAASFIKLARSANDLNSVSDELGKSITEVDEGLRKLNLGIPAWVTVLSGDDAERSPNSIHCWAEELGYAKVNGKWGVSLRRRDWHDDFEDSESETRWLFNEGPRQLRLAAIDKLPELLENLSGEAQETTEKAKARLADLKAVADAVNPPRVPRVKIIDRVAGLVVHPINVDSTVAK